MRAQLVDSCPPPLLSICFTPFLRLSHVVLVLICLSLPALQVQ
jgi:hypothetical protein